MCDKQIIRDIIEWDAASWGQVVPFWQQHAGDLRGMKVLDIGGRNGGLSLYFALAGCTVVCSDLDGPADAAITLHKKYEVSESVSYRKINATKIEYPDGAFDIVCFKSVLGGIGRNDDFQQIQQAISEIHRVLRRGGKVLFAENLKASFLHTFLRRLSVQWGSAWRYLGRDELQMLFSMFADLQLHCCGFLAAFGRSERQRNALHTVDVVIDRFVPESCRYIALGCATK